MRRVEPLINLALLLPRRPREFRDRVAGYADLGLERLWRSSPAYETARWQDVLRDIEEHLGRVPRSSTSRPSRRSKMTRAGFWRTSAPGIRSARVGPRTPGSPALATFCAV